MIRPAQPEDFPQMLQVQLDCIGGLSDVYNAEERAAWAAYLEREGPDRYAQYGSNRVFVNEAGEVAAFASWSESRTVRTAAIECLYTQRQDRGRGIGRTLLQAAEASISPEALVSIRSTLNARPFYEHYGYKFMSHSVARAGFSIALMYKSLQSSGA